jgi:hypothetical protein
MNALLVRWLASELVAFSLFPILFVLAGGVDAELGWIDGMAMMAFEQFFSPYQLWRIPFVAGTAIALLWHVRAGWGAEVQPEG